MKVTTADMDLCAAVLSRRFARFLARDQLKALPNRGYFDPSRSVHRAINARAGIRAPASLDLNNALALLALVRANIARSITPELGLFDYMQSKAYGRYRDERRAPHYQRFLRRGLQQWRYA